MEKDTCFSKDTTQGSPYLCIKTHPSQNWTTSTRAWIRPTRKQITLTSHQSGPREGAKQWINHWTSPDFPVQETTSLDRSTPRSTTMGFTKTTTTRMWLKRASKKSRRTLQWTMKRSRIKVEMKGIYQSGTLEIKWRILTTISRKRLKLNLQALGFSILSKKIKFIKQEMWGRAYKTVNSSAEYLLTFWLIK